jgi:hypothetical protein
MFRLAVIDPASLAVIRRVELPGCDHDHGLALDSRQRLAYPIPAGPSGRPELLVYEPASSTTG